MKRFISASVVAPARMFHIPFVLTVGTFRIKSALNCSNFRDNLYVGI